MKIYRIPFLTVVDYKEYARVCYAFLTMDWGWPGQREMNIIGCEKSNTPLPILRLCGSKSLSGNVKRTTDVSSSIYKKNVL